MVKIAGAIVIKRKRGMEKIIKRWYKDKTPNENIVGDGHYSTQSSVCPDAAQFTHINQSLDQSSRSIVARLAFRLLRFVVVVVVVVTPCL